MNKQEIINKVSDDIDIDYIITSFKQQQIKKEDDKIPFIIGIVVSIVIENIFKNYEIKER